MKKGLRIAEDDRFVLPLPGAHTQTLVVYGGKGMGKSTLGRVVCEELAAAHLKFSYLDPLDVNWGLRHGATKADQGIDLVILGGSHGDIPIEPTSGKVVADFVVDEDVSTIVVPRGANGSMWGAGERIRFVADYTGHLYERQGERRRPLMQLIDECGRFCPQLAGRAGDADIARCISNIEQLVEWGRNAATGVMLITQRSARMAKSVSELADMMVAFRTVGPNSVDAVMRWLSEHVEKEHHHGLKEQLRSLERGSALVVSPGWLQHEGVVRMRPSRTYDSSATPESGKARRAPGPARQPDLDQYRARMAETIERARQDDPRALRQEIQALKKQLASATRTQAAPAKTIETIPHDVVTGAHELEVVLSKIQSSLTDSWTVMDAARKELGGLLRDGAKGVAALQRAVSRRFKSPVPHVEAVADLAQATGRRPVQAIREKGVSPKSSPRATDRDDGGPGKPHRKILTALAQAGRPLSLVELALRSSSRRTSGGFRQALADARKHGWVVDLAEGITIVEAGYFALGDYETLPEGSELLEHWAGRLKAPRDRILRALAASYPAGETLATLADLVGCTTTSGGYRQGLADLRRYRFIVDQADKTIRLSHDLVDATRRVA